MKTFETEQEKFWAGEFGDTYIARNKSDRVLASNIALFAKILPYAPGIKSIIEYGANVGMNLLALRQLLPSAEVAAVEINAAAGRELQKIEGIKVHCQSILEYESADAYDLVLIKGVLIHINPDKLPDVYDKLSRSSKRYILLAEYYNPNPVEVTYRGHAGRLFKRDFAGEMLDRFKDLRLVTYGFAYKRDPQFAQDDITWFLLEKNQERN